MNRRTLITGSIAAAAGITAAPVVASASTSAVGGHLSDRMILFDEKLRETARQLKKFIESANRLRNVPGDIFDTQRQLFDLAQRYRVPLKYTVETYARLAGESGHYDLIAATDDYLMRTHGYDPKRMNTVNDSVERVSNSFLQYVSEELI